MTTAKSRPSLARFNRVPWGVITLTVFAAAPFVTSQTVLQLLVVIGVNSMLAQSINVLTGLAGQISLGQAAIFGFGAYVSAILTTKYDLSVLVGAPVAIAACLVLGALISIPAGRVKEFYLAMVTLGLGLVAFQIFRHWRDMTGGFSGMSSIPSPPLGTLAVGGREIGLVSYYWITLLMVAVVTWMVRNLMQSRFGRSFVALHTNEVAAGALGIDTAARKRLAYVLSAGLAGFAGVLYAHLVGYLSPDAFSVHVSISIVVFAVLGGLRSLYGPFLGAGVLTLLPDRLQVINHYQHVIYGLVLLLVFIVLPKGLAGLLPGRTALISRRAESGRAPVMEGKEDPTVSKESRREEVPEADRPATGVEVSGVSKSFGGVHALKGADFSVEPGEIHGLIGPNGSGKSTLLNVISGIYTPDEGSVRLGGEVVTGWPQHRLVRAGLGRTFQHPHVFPDLTILENVLTGSEIRFRHGVVSALLGAPSVRRQEAKQVRRAYEAIELVGLEEPVTTLAGELPFGRQRMVELARMLCSQPKALMLDEPAAGLSEGDLGQLARTMKSLQARGTSVVLIEHHLDFLLEVVDHVTVLDNGAVIFRGLPEDVKKDRRVVEAYLGSAAAKEVSDA